MQKIAEKINSGSNFLVVGHVGPDGDTLGSGLALLLALRSMGKSANFVVDGEVPSKLSFLLSYGPIGNEDLESIRAKGYDTVIAVDVSDAGRLGKYAAFFMAHPNRIVLDHHVTNEGFGDANLILPYGAVGQMVLELIELLGVPVTAEMANALFVAISTDTGHFSYNNTDGPLLAAVSRLRDAGADIPWLSEQLYRNRTFGSVRLMGRALSRIHLSHNNTVGDMYVLKSDYDELGAKEEDTEELINYLREIESVEIAIFLKELEDGKYKVSFRSSKYADVSALAGRFGGGGHKFASGCTVEGDLDTLRVDIVRNAIEILEQTE